MAEICPKCGVRQGAAGVALTTVSDKRIAPAAALCAFLGVLGVHRFYVGKVGTGILQLVTFGGFGVWWLIDFIMIVVGSFRDKDGARITEWV
ncbi:MAG: TM2 domain-containing protein [Gemmatimonadaceae bacterium]